MGNFTFFSKAILNPGNVRFGLRDPDFSRIYIIMVRSNLKAC
jgi:hypothetical protein